jgi:hypothetical protein
LIQKTEIKFKNKSSENQNLPMKGGRRPMIGNSNLATNPIGYQPNYNNNLLKTGWVGPMNQPHYKYKGSYNINNQTPHSKKM